MDLSQQIMEAVKTAPESSLENLVQMAPSDGLFLEFGVWQGHTINRIAKTVSNKTIYGFDSFEGLPKKWHTYDKGHFACDIPENLENNVYLVIGWFDDTLPWFTRTREDKVSFIHVDCDLYESTKSVFDHLKDRIQDGCIIVFDELYNYEGWQDHEFKAFYEFLRDTGYSWECVGKYSVHQAGFRINV